MASKLLFAIQIWWYGVLIIAPNIDTQKSAATSPQD